MNDKGFVPTIEAWFTHPFNTNGTVLNWVLFVGLIIVAAWLWNTVIFQITE